MHTKGPVYCRPHEVGTPMQEYKRKKWGNGKQGSGPTGYKLRPARLLAKAMAEQANKYKSRRVQ